MQQEKMYALVEAWETSGLSKKDFSKKAGISYHSFLYWSKRYNQEGNRHPKSSAEIFVPLQMEYPANIQDPPLEIAYPNGVKLTCAPSISSKHLRELIHFF